MMDRREWMMSNEVFPGITVDPRVVHESPVVAGTRVPVEVVVGELAGGSSFEDVMADYHLTNDQIRAALAYAALREARGDEDGEPTTH
jgi:uncharacterized protein (DUF433 family)